MTKKNFLSIVFFSVSVALFYYVLKDLKYKDFIKQSSKVEWKMVGLSAVCMILSTWFRNLRWLMLFRPLGYNIKKIHALYALLLSYPANLLIPQSSFFVRASYLKKMSAVPYGPCLGTIMAEKLIDGIVVFGLFFVFLFSNFAFDFSFFNTHIFTIYLAITILSVLCLSIFFVKINLNKFWIKTKNIVINQIQGFKIGLKTSKSIDNKKLFFLYTILIWLPYIAIFYFLLKGSVLKESIGFLLPTELAVMANIGWIFPSQAGIGSYHFFINKIMILYGFDTIKGVFFAFFSHSIITFCDIIFGSIVVIINFKVLLNFLFLKYKPNNTNLKYS
jgi:uncharacterized membrane protein YbhN (UPF0104 family)